MKRRALLAAVSATGAAFAGCLGDDDDDGRADTSGGNGALETPTPDGDEGDARDGEAGDKTDGASVDWDAVPEFRRWLTGESESNGNRRFDYNAREAVDDEFVTVSPAIGFAEQFDDEIDGTLIHNRHEIHLGEFDREAVVEAAESFTGEPDTATEGIEYEQTGRYEGYAMFTDGLAVGEDAIVWNLSGEEPTTMIDTRLDASMRLETTEPRFTSLFERLPDGGVVSGQYGPPVGGEVNTDAIHLWGVSHERVDNQELTWVFAIEEGEPITDELLDELEAIGEETESTVDGQFVRVEGSFAL